MRLVTKIDQGVKNDYIKIFKFLAKLVGDDTFPNEVEMPKDLCSLLDALYIGEVEGSFLMHHLAILST